MVLVSSVRDDRRLLPHCQSELEIVERTNKEVGGNTPEHEHRRPQRDISHAVAHCPTVRLSIVQEGTLVPTSERKRERMGDIP